MASPEARKEPCDPSLVGRGLSDFVMPLAVGFEDKGCLSSLFQTTLPWSLYWSLNWSLFWSLSWSCNCRGVDRALSVLFSVCEVGVAIGVIIGVMFKGVERELLTWGVNWLEIELLIDPRAEETSEEPAGVGGRMILRWAV